MAAFDKVDDSLQQRNISQWNAAPRFDPLKNLPDNGQKANWRNVISLQLAYRQSSV